MSELSVEMANPENLTRGQSAGAGGTPLFARFARLGTNVAWASQAAARSHEAQQAMTRARYGLGVGLAVVAALIVHSALHGFR